MARRTIREPWSLPVLGVLMLAGAAVATIAMVGPDAATAVTVPAWLLALIGTRSR